VDFLANSYSPGGKPWPVSYGDLEPYFTKAERELHVHWSGDGIAAFGEFLAKAGYVIEKTPLSEWEGEPIRIAKSHLPGFTRSRVGKLINNARVTKIVSGKNGAITSFHVFGFDGVRKEIQARFYVLACGGIETPRILLLSRSREYPNGIGNEYDHVGRYFMEHMQVAGEGRVDLQARPYHGPYVEAISWQFHEDFKSRGHGGVVVEFQSPREDTPTMGISPIMEMEPSGRNRVALDEKLKDSFDNPKAKVVLKLSEKDIKTIETAQSLMRQIFSSLGIKSVEISQKVDWLHHHMGTCRMASDPREGVVDANLKVHGTENLYVAGSASFVTSSAAPPTLSIVALSLRLADHLIRKLQNRKSTGGLVSAAGKGFASDRRNGSMHRQSNRDHT
jgi:choline dehydrogenase-like flavoprotein